MICKKNIPNILSGLRIFSSVFLFYAFSVKGITMLLWTFLFMALTDFFDGFLARRWNCCTVLGAILDPVGDKILTNICLIGLYITWDVAHFMMILSLARDLLISIGFFLLWPHKIKEPKISFISKINTAVQWTYILFLTLHMTDKNHALWEIGMESFYYLSIATIIYSFIEYCRFFISMQKT
ncbi:MAG: CDP-alcohol phosphatidyltransferase family protein [Alphaproteobacteria bacterium]|nr:CDP-alcohol phosphatidyltransferase family protein [Alphaproteobacteria bacterium]